MVTLAFPSLPAAAAAAGPTSAASSAAASSERRAPIACCAGPAKENGAQQFFQVTVGELCPLTVVKSASAIGTHTCLACR